jgi:cytochrome b561
MGIFATMIPEGVPYRLEYYVVHKTVGVVIIGLVIARIIWNFVSPRPESIATLRPLERKLAKTAHVLLYFFMLAMPLTGFIMTSYFGAPTYFFLWELDPLWATNEKAVQLWGLLHKYLFPYLIFLVLGAHILGVLKHQFLDKHIKVLRRMVS